MVQSDGKESVGMAEDELPLGVREERSGNPAPIPGDVVDYADSESILPLFEGRFGYGVEEEDEEGGGLHRSFDQRGGITVNGCATSFYPGSAAATIATSVGAGGPKG